MSLVCNCPIEITGVISLGSSEWSHGKEEKVLEKMKSSLFILMYLLIVAEPALPPIIPSMVRAHPRPYLPPPPPPAHYVTLLLGHCQHFFPRGKLTLAISETWAEALAKRAAGTC